MDSERALQNQWYGLFIIHNLKLIAFAFPDERIALLLHILVMVFFCLFGGVGGPHDSKVAFCVRELSNF